MCVILRNILKFGVQFHKLPEGYDDFGAVSGKRNPSVVKNPNEKFHIWNHFL